MQEALIKGNHEVSWLTANQAQKPANGHGETYKEYHFTEFQERQPHERTDC